MESQCKKSKTRNDIIEAFQYLMTAMPFDKIRVHNITDLAGVNRNSFYYHFIDKYDLLYKVVTQMLVIDYDTTSGKSLIQQSVEEVPRILHYFQEHRRFFKSAFIDDRQHSFYNFFQKLINDWFTTILDDTYDILDTGNNSFHKTQTRFYVAGYSQLLIYWLYHEPDKPAEVLAEEILLIFNSAFKR